jgi:phosphoribosyl 1,2-cyclic phosphodiesterase
MDAYLLGTGTSHGMPAPMCPCEYCEKVERKRTCLLVKCEERNMLFDVSPEFNMQMQELDIYNVEDVFITHHHHDHSSGLKDLYHTTSDIKPSDIREEEGDFVDSYFGNTYQLYLSPYTTEVFKKELPYIMKSERLVNNRMEDNSTVSIGETIFTSFVAEHTRGYIGFIIERNNDKIVYFPDYGKLRTEATFNNVNVLICDGGPILGYKNHGSKSDINRVMSRIDADETYLVNVSEHISQRPTKFLEERASKYGAKIVEDGYKIL